MTTARELEIIKTESGKIIEMLHKKSVPKLYLESKTKALSEISELIQLSATEPNIIEGHAPIKKSQTDPTTILRLKTSGVWPTESRIVTSAFGMRRHPIYKVMKLHRGVDIGGVLGRSKIFAWNNGRVVDVGTQQGYGRIVQIYHGDGVSSFYAHLHTGSTVVSVGQDVTAGQMIANIGNTGIGSGAHLHFEIRINGAQVDPISNGYINPKIK